MTHKWKELYGRLPQNRREAIEARVAGEVARIEGKPYDANPFPAEDGDTSLFRLWRTGYFDADEGILAKAAGEPRTEVPITGCPICHSIYGCQHTHPALPSTVKKCIDCNVEFTLLTVESTLTCPNCKLAAAESRIAEWKLAMNEVLGADASDNWTPEDLKRILGDNIFFAQERAKLLVRTEAALTQAQAEIKELRALPSQPTAPQP